MHDARELSLGHRPGRRDVERERSAREQGPARAGDGPARGLEVHAVEGEARLRDARGAADAGEGDFLAGARDEEQAVDAGVVHGDLSAYNLLWWNGRMVLIDLPQAVEFITNADAPDLLHRDVVNVAAWFGRHGIEVDVEAVFAELLALAF